MTSISSPAFPAFLRVLLLLLMAVGTGRAQIAPASTSLLESGEVTKGWTFNNGAEFPGATGGLTSDASSPHENHLSLKLTGDFTKGGAYVQAGRMIAGVDPEVISLWLKNPGGDRLTVRLNDSTGQTHQIALQIEAQPGWQQVIFPLEKFFARRGQADAVTSVAKYEAWGGAKDGKWHGPAKAIYLLISPSGGTKVRNLWLGDVALTTRTQLPAFRSDFENLTALPVGWSTTGQVALDPKSASPGKQSLLLSRTLEKIDQPCSVNGPSFPVSPGPWQIGLTLKAALKSPDNSYRGVVFCESFDDSGKALDRTLVAEVFGQRDWQKMQKRVELPKGAATARLQAELEKADGQLWLDDLSAVRLVTVQKRDDRISRILFSTAQLGNLLLPADPRRVDFVVEALRPLSDEQLTFRAVVRDYWGAEQAKAMEGKLESAEKKGAGASYRASVDLSTVPLDIGRYYEVQVEIPLGAGVEPFRQSTSLAILPEAETKRYKPEEVPFTSRNWDNRIPEYIKLTDRLGIRICGLWGGWSAQPPYAPEAPGLELCRQLGMGWLTTTPAKFIEQGKTNYTEEGLRQGVRNLIEKYGKERPMILNLGNEPHGTGAKVLANVAAYKAIYEEAKKTDPSIPVVATSVEPNEEYFKAGYGQWCDAFDFHIYESHANVRRTIEEYRALMKKYGCEKPIWSTELGLNSQGMTRRAVAAEVFKKTATFFAAGGANMAWFGLLYPDPDGKSFGSSGDSHNVFDCRYKCYAPRLDAVALYHAVNAIGIKKFVAEQQYPDGVSAFLFRDREGRALQIVWKDRGRQDIGLPLAGVKEVRVVQLDGRTRTFQTGGESVTLTVSEDPILLLYEGGTDQLPPQLVKPLATLQPTDQSLTAGAPIVVNVAPLPDTLVEMETPPFWTSKPEAAGKKPGRRYTVTPPAESAVHTAVLTIVVRDASGKNRGELTYVTPISR